MSATAKLFMHGRSQAVRLPKEFRFEGTEVRVSKVGDKVVLEPLHERNRRLPTVWAGIDALRNGEDATSRRAAFGRPAGEARSAQYSSTNVLPRHQHRDLRPSIGAPAYVRARLDAELRHRARRSALPAIALFEMRYGAREKRSASTQ